MKETCEPAWVHVPGDPAAPRRAKVTPPLTSLNGPTDKPPRQLPRRLNEFTGRQPELSQLNELLGTITPTTRAVVVTVIGGLGGVGKSTLAIEAAWRAAGHFPDPPRRHPAGGSGCHSHSGGGTPGTLPQLGRLAFQLARALWGFYVLRGHSQDRIQADQAILELGRRVQDRSLQAHARCHLGNVYRRLARHGEAVECQLASLSIFRELGSRHRQAEVLRDLGDALHSIGRDAEARASWRIALPIFEEPRLPETSELRSRVAGGSPEAPSAAGGK